MNYPMCMLLTLPAFAACKGPATLPADATTPSIRDGATSDVELADVTPVTEAVVQMTILDGRDHELLSDVKVAIDTDVGRFVEVSNESGEVSVEIAYFSSTVDAIIAKEGFSLLSVVAVDIADLVDGDGEPVRMFPPRQEFRPNRQLEVDFVGAPAGGQACVSALQPGWFLVCTDGERIRAPYSDSQEPTGEVTAFAIDPDGQLVDFEVAEIATEGERLVVDVTFDGVLDIEVRTRSITLQVPEEHRETGISEIPWMVAAIDRDTNAIWSLVSDIERDPSDGSYSLSFHELAPPERSVRYAVVAATAADVGNRYARSLRRFDELPDVVMMPSGPEVASDAPVSLQDDMEWTPASSEASLWQLQVLNSSGAVVHTSFVLGQSHAALPRLPDQYDRSVSYPFEGSAGMLTISEITVASSLRDALSPTGPLGVANRDWVDVEF